MYSWFSQLETSIVRLLLDDILIKSTRETSMMTPPSKPWLSKRWIFPTGPPTLRKKSTKGSLTRWGRRWGLSRWTDLWEVSDSGRNWISLTEFPNWRKGSLSWVACHSKVPKEHRVSCYRTIKVWMMWCQIWPKRLFYRVFMVHVSCMVQNLVGTWLNPNALLGTTTF